ncbi:MAG TPA: ABC transporter permease [Clostridia bacterium]|nr:ABC transporter permease [Clostridia bacterium]
MKKILNIIISFIALISIWQLAVSLGNWNVSLFPSPLSVIQCFKELIESGALAAGIKDSLYRFAAGYCMAALSGIILGLFLGWFRKFWSFVNPVVQLIRPISPIAWLPFVVLWFGIGDLPAMVIIFIAAFFPILLTTISAVGKVDQTYIKVAKNFGLNQFQTLTKIVLPSAFPFIATGLHLALGTAWVFLVAGEMVGSQTGLGYMIIDARNNLRADLLLASILTIGIVGLILDSLIGFAEKKILNLSGFVPNERGA